MASEPDEAAELGLTPRQVELLLWQLVMDLGGGISTQPAEDIPKRRVVFLPDGDYIEMLCEGRDGE